MAFRFGIAVFPGTWSDRDFLYAVSLFGAEAVPLWHQDRDLQQSDCVVLPGGFAHGDYLRPGAIARFSPLMESVAEHARGGGLLLGSCNGFQILCEAGLLPGALLRNQSLRYVCRQVDLRIETALSGTSPGEVLRMPISHGEGRYFVDRETLARLRDLDLVAMRYCDGEGRDDPGANPNGSLDAIAAVLNEGRNVLGLMPHPERACENLLGSSDGLRLLAGLAQRRALAA